MNKLSSCDISGLMSEDEIMASDYTILHELKKTRQHLLINKKKNILSIIISI